ncbi:MAG TPA: hypothetical protein VHM91_00030 [Verrucomicrobiales bacterium]|nr:hypothetical protein [Verrucomicrobiales bacterium]
MREYEIYVPLLDNEGNVIDPGKLESLKERLRERFGGFTYFPQEGEGQWITGGQTFRDRIVILRVLTPPESDSVQWFRELKAELTREYNQADFLITSRRVELV